jgi:iron complex transport system substrate-binding protein
MAGHRVRLPPPEKIKRIACLDVLCYERLFLLGASDRIVVMMKTDPPWMRTIDPTSARIPQISATVNVEELLRLHADVAFRVSGYPPDAVVHKLAAAGIPVLDSQVGKYGAIHTLDEFVASRNRMMRLYGQVLGGPYAARAEAWCAYHDAMVAMVRARVQAIPRDRRLRLFHRRGGLGSYTQGDLTANTYGYGVLAGADMEVKGESRIAQGAVTVEEILKWNPDVVNVGRGYPSGLVKSDPLWKSVAALRHGRIAETPDGVFYWDGSSEGVLLMLYVAKELYPERFSDFDLAAAVRDYYSRFYHYKLDQRQLALLLGGKAPGGKRR